MTYPQSFMWGKEPGGMLLWMQCARAQETLKLRYNPEHDVDAAMQRIIDAEVRR